MKCASSASIKCASLLLPACLPLLSSACFADCVGCSFYSSFTTTTTTSSSSCSCSCSRTASNIVGNKILHKGSKGEGRKGRGKLCALCESSRQSVNVGTLTTATTAHNNNELGYAPCLSVCVCVSLSLAVKSVCALSASSFCLITLQTEREQQQQQQRLQCAEQKTEGEHFRHFQSQFVACTCMQEDHLPPPFAHNWLNSRGAKLIAYFQAAIKN